MYGIFTYIWVLFRVNVVKYSIHGAYGYGLKPALYFGFWKTTRPRQSPSNPAQPTAPTIATKHTAGVVAAECALEVTECGEFEPSGSTDNTEASL
jgi:hypothetical protein